MLAFFHLLVHVRDLISLSVSLLLKGVRQLFLLLQLLHQSVTVLVHLFYLLLD